jgi:UDP:flavonoid glycosyltransferase YjiC (YdhE family)
MTLDEVIDPAQVPSRRGVGDVVVVRSAPHTQILHEADVLIIHCGHGTAMKGLAAGVPLSCMPMGRDQNDVAARVTTIASGHGCVNPVDHIEAFVGPSSKRNTAPATWLRNRVVCA